LINFKRDEEDEAWKDYREKFSELYDEANYGSSLQSLVMRASHNFVEKDFDAQKCFGQVLEIGAGTGEHFSFVRHKFEKYTLTDHDERVLEIAKSKLSPLSNEGVMFEAQKGSKLSYSDDSFDRLIATHVLEHIKDPHLALKDWSRVVRHGGTLSILIPTDPGMAWRLGRRFGPRKKALAKGFAYDYIMAREHVNSCNNLIAILRHYFPDSKERWWPLSIPSIDLNLFFVFHTTLNKC
jgi:phosphatidylethanolamine/phosphatidyl-N-methylethanolamine N-methyltransferase